MKPLWSQAGGSLSSLIPDSDRMNADVIASFCHYLHFFRSPQAALPWLAEHRDSFLLSLADAYALGRRINPTFRFRHVPFAQVLPGASGRTWRSNAPHIRAKARRGATKATIAAVAKIARTARERRLAMRRARSDTCLACACANTSRSKTLYAMSTHTKSAA